MKLNNNNEQEKIIGTDDIFISSNNSSLGNTLGEVLTKLDLDILDLKRNVKWLYKYGGVGGNGGSGGSTTASLTKISCVITYTDNNGNTVLKKINEGDFFNIKEGTSITVTCTIVSIKSLNEYVFSLNNLKTTIKATDINGAITTVPSNNMVYTVTLIGETTESISFSVYTKVMEVTHEIVLNNGITILSNSSIYLSLLDAANYIFTFINNLPDNFEYSIDEVLINLEELSSDKYHIEEKVNTVNNTKTLILKIPLKELFTSYGIYSIQINYTFGTDTFSLADSFIYQDDSAFIYGWSNTINVYNSPTSNPIISNNYNNVINFRIYPAKSDSLTLKYSLTIEVDSKNTEMVVLSGTIYSYTVVNNIKDENTKEIPIKFLLDGKEYTYYIYLLKSPDVTYFFENDQGKGYYLVVSCNSEDTNDDIIAFPEKDPTIEDNPIIISSLLEYLLKTVSSNFGTLSDDDLVSNFVKSTGQDRGNLRVDALFSFGIKYSGSNWDLPILGIKNLDNTGTKLIQVYKNSIVFNSIELEICIPNDDRYHLVQLYFKSDYKTSNDTNIINTDNTKLVVVIYIDGVLETKPFEVSSFFILAKYTSLIYYPGLWQFNHIGVATFNGIPTSKITGIKQSCVAKYLLDFDPIIPSNYYLTYKNIVLEEELSEKFDKTIYESLSINTSSKNGSEQWVNYFSYNKEKSLHLNKFINVNPSVIASLAPSEMEVYCIVPESTNLSLIDSGFDSSPDSHLNQFVYNTFKSYLENDLITKVSCNFLKWKSDKWVDVISNVGVGDLVILFYVKYLGSSTLLYSCKNFEIGIKSIYNLDMEEFPVFFTPDVDLFPYMESSFNLKADVVDSSHSNNVVIGNFVNDYMTSPFNTTKKKYKSCLTGKPILLFILNNAIDPTDNKTVLDDSYIFLGIYSLNLNRNSVHNLGYSTLVDSSGKEIQTTGNTQTDERCCDSITKFHILQQTEKESFSNNFAVAEVQGNGMLYDYSQFDESLLANQVLGDFYVSDNDRISKEYSSVFVKPFKALSEIIYNYIIKEKIFYTTDLLSTFKSYKKLENPQDYYYTDNGQITLLPADAVIVDSNDINNLSEGVPYHTYKENGTTKVGLINNPLHLFHLICNLLGIPITNLKTTYYYIEELSTLIYNLENPTAKIDLESAVKYFVTCMAFAMVDSVLKNLTIKCPDTKNTNIWYLAFYDMDTAFGISNSGGNTSFQAFSDYVDSDGYIILDYSPLYSSTLFDTPSSFIFLYAKYMDIITLFGMSETTNGIFPFSEWTKLRGTGGSFESGTAFCKKYVDDYFGDINPLIWNLNYQYKYFSESRNASISDNESGRFNGTRRYARKEYLNKRFLYLDVLFGFKNAKTIGFKLDLYITNGSSSIPSNSDIKINSTMFPQFQKGVSGNISVEVRDLPKTPIVLLISTSISLLYMTDSKGMATIKGNIITNDDCGFYGTNELTSISECGLFLKNTSKSNTIVNDSLTSINISTGTGAKDTVLEIDLLYLTSVKNITISSSRTLYYNVLSIKNGGNKNIILNNVTLLNILCTSLLLLNFTVSGTLSISNCVASVFTFDSVSASTLIHSNNLFTSESWQAINILKDLNINNSACLTLSLENTKAKNFVYTASPNLSQININSCTLNTFSISYSNKLSNILLKNSNIKTFILNREASGTSSLITGSLNLGFTNTEVSLSIPGLNAITLLLLGAVKTCNLLTNAFFRCTKLSSIPDITYNIRGSYIFREADSIPLNIVLKCNLPTTTNYSGLFLGNQAITESFVKSWFKTKTANSLDFLFCSCHNILLGWNTANNAPSASFKEFESILVLCILRSSNISKTITSTFYDSAVKIISKDITEALLAKGVTALSLFIAGQIYIEKLALDNFTNVQFDVWTTLYVYDDDGIILKSSITDYFSSSSKIQSITNFTPSFLYNNLAITIDFKDGFPSTLKSISMMYYITSLNILNLECAFDNTSNCTLYGFQNTSISTELEYFLYPDLFLFLFKSNSDGSISPKVTLLLDTDINTSNYFSFPKKISATNLLKILDYYKDKSTKNISWIFNRATIYDCTENLLDYKLNYFTNLIGTFAYCTFVNTLGTAIAIKIDDAFSTENADDKLIEVNSLRRTFESCYLIRFTHKLHIKNLKDFRYTFRNCTFKNPLFENSLPVWSPTGMYKIQPYTDEAFQILPNNYFDICGNLCNIEGCFKCSDFKVAHLTGFIPDTDTLHLASLIEKNAIISELFTNCNVTYLPLKDTSKYRIFPSWYTLLLITDKYNVYIPFTTTVSGDTVYLFESSKSIKGTYNTLPNLPDLYVGTGHYYDYITGNNANLNCLLKVSVDSDTFPSLSGVGSYKHMIPLRLAYLLRFELTPTEVISGMKLGILNTSPVFLNSRPVINMGLLEYLSAIFDGDEIDSVVKNYIVLN